MILCNMRLGQKILLVVFHVIVLVLCILITMNNIQLRWRLGYIIFWMVVSSGISLYFIHFSKYMLNVMTKLYAFWWMLYSVIGILITYLTFDSVYCETDRYIMKKPAEIIGFDTAILYEKKGLQEIEKQRYKFVYPKSILPLDSIGVIVIYGDYYDGETLAADVAILPLDDTFDEAKASKYAKKHNIRLEP